MEIAIQLLNDLRSTGRTIATAESLTGGLVAAALTAIPGSSDCVRGGVIAYATDLKAGLLGVDEQDLAAVGPVHADIAAQMALGAASACGSALGVATTGVAGPDEQNGVSVGTVFVSVADSASGFTMTRQLNLDGDRSAIRDSSVGAALSLVAEYLSDLDVVGQPELERE